MPAHLTPVIAATAHWLVTAYPASTPLFGGALVQAQARQAVTVSAWLRYPTAVDAALVHLVGPGGAARLDWLVGFARADQAWRSWVDEVLASWAACLLTDATLASSAVTVVAGTEHASGLPRSFRRLLEPDRMDRRAGALLRHPDLLAPVARLHRAALLQRLGRA